MTIDVLSKKKNNINHSIAVVVAAWMPFASLMDAGSCSLSVTNHVIFALSESAIRRLGFDSNTSIGLDIRHVVVKIWRVLTHLVASTTFTLSLFVLPFYPRIVVKEWNAIQSTSLRPLSQMPKRSPSLHPQIETPWRPPLPLAPPNRFDESSQNKIEVWSWIKSHPIITGVAGAALVCGIAMVLMPNEPLESPILPNKPLERPDVIKSCEIWNEKKQWLSQSKKKELVKAIFSATDYATVERNYRKVIKMFHPDKNPGAKTDTIMSCLESAKAYSKLFC